MIQNSETPRLIVPNGATKVLLHSCCAPCTGEIIETLIHSEIDLTIFFYNPNIHPRSEYEKRKTEIARFAVKKGIPFYDGDYDPQEWFKRILGLEKEPERGRRCSACFDFRLERSAQYAIAHGFKVFTSSFGISRWKDFDQVNDSGMRVASRYPNLVYWTYNWRLKNGSRRMYEIARREEFYRQDYCGCVYSQKPSAPLPEPEGEFN